MLLLAVIPDPAPPVVIPPAPPSPIVVEAGPYSEPGLAPWRESPMSGPSFSYTYVQGAELPALRLLWADRNGVDIDFSSGWTFTFLAGPIGQPAIFAKTAGIQGGPGYIDVIWAPDIGADLNLLPVGRHDAEIRARRTADTADRVRQGELIILAGIQG